MLKNVSVLKNLKDFSFWNTEWYKNIRDSYNNYKFKALAVAFITASTIPFIMLLNDLFKQEYSLVWNYSIPFLVLLCVTIYLFTSKKTEILAPVSLYICVSGFSLAVLLPGSHSIYITLFFVFPSLALAISDCKSGRNWFFFFLTVVFSTYLVTLTKLYPHWKMNLQPLQIFLSLSTVILLFLISYTKEKLHESNFSWLIKRLVYDDISGLPNKEVLENSINPDKKYLFSIISIENFDKLVTLFGYEFSNKIQKFAADRIIQLESSYNFNAFQLHNYEFGILLELHDVQFNEAFAYKICEKIISDIEKCDLKYKDTYVKLITKIGCTFIYPENNTAFLSQASSALIEARRDFKVFSLFKDSQFEKEAAISSLKKHYSLIRNKENDTFKVLYQPIVDNTTKKIAWYEALLRVKDESTNNLVSIYPYLDIAKSTGFYKYISEFVVSQAIEKLSEIDCDISINISVSDIIRPSFLELIVRNSKKLEESKNKIIFEIVETEEIINIEKCTYFIEQIKKYGCRAAIDDFGSGYSNYSSILKLPVDIIKIDGHIVKNISKDIQAKEIIRGIVNICKLKGIKTVAEYIEDKIIYDEVKKLGVEFSQGYFFGKPEIL